MGERDGSLAHLVPKDGRGHGIVEEFERPIRVAPGPLDSARNPGEGSARLIGHATAEDRGPGAGGLLALGGHLARRFRFDGEGHDERKDDKPGDERGTPGAQTTRWASGRHADSPREWTFRSSM